MSLFHEFSSITNIRNFTDYFVYFPPDILQNSGTNPDKDKFFVERKIVAMYEILPNTSYSPPSISQVQVVKQIKVIENSSLLL